MTSKPKKRRKLPPAPKKRVGFGRVMVYLVALFVFVLPLFVWPTSTEYGYSKSIFALVAVSLLLILWAGWALVKGEWRIRVPWISVPVLGFVVASLFSLIRATNGRMVIQSLTLVVFFFLFYLVVTQFVKEKKDVTLILYSLLLSAFLASLYGLLQYLGVMRGAFGNSGLAELISTMGNRNYLGEFLACLLFPAVILIVRLHSRLLRTLAVGLVAFSFGTALLVRQTSILVALPTAFALFLVGIAIFRPIEPIRRNRAWLVGLFAVLALTFAIEAPSGPLNSLVGLSADTKGSWLARLWSQNSGRVRSWDWWVGWEMLRDHPLVGVGLGNYKIEFLPYKAQFLASPRGAGYDFYIARAAQAHNEYVQVAAELGALGIVALLALLVTIPVSLWRRLRRNRDEADRFDLLLMSAGVVSFLVVALVGFPAHLPATSLVLVLTLGLASSRAYGEGAEVEVSLKGWPLAGVATATVVVCLAVSVLAGRDFSGDVLLGRGIRELQAGQLQLAAADLKASAALDFSPSQVYYHLGTLEAKQGRYQEAAAYLEKCLTRFVAENVYLNLANLAVNSGDTAKARQNVDLLLATRPFPELEIQGELLKALIFVRQGDSDTAIRELEALAQAQPDFEKPYIILGDLYRARGLTSKARQNYEQALTLIKGKLTTARAKLTPGATLRAEEYAAARDEVDLLTREKEATETGLAKLSSP